MKELVSSLHGCLENVFPPVSLKLLSVAAQDDPDFSQIASIISMDPGITTAVLNLVNSSYYGLSQKVDSVQRAAVTLGSREILKMAISLSMLSDAGNRGDAGSDAFANWRLLVWGAVAAELLADRLCPRDAERAYICTLLKDLSLLLIQRERPELLPENGSTLVCRGYGEAVNETLVFGGHHGSLTVELLNNLDIPLTGMEAIRDHHDIDGLENHDPLTRCVILATRWAELELGCSQNPFEILQFENFLRSRLDMDEEVLEELRETCITRFRSMLATLSIDEADPSRRYYQHSLSDLYQSYLLSTEVMTAQGGLASVARTITRHLRWTFGLDCFELSLAGPENSQWTLFFCRDGNAEQTWEGLSEQDLPWELPTQGIHLSSGGNTLGEMRFCPKALSKDKNQNLLLYVRFLSQAFEHYCLRQAMLELKAQTLDTLPVGVARLDAKGRNLAMNSRMAEFLGFDEPKRNEPVLPRLARKLRFDQPEDWKRFFTDPKRHTLSKILRDYREDSAEDISCIYFSANKTLSSGRPEILLLMEDITEVTDLEIQAHKHLDFLEQLVSAMKDLVFIVDDSGCITYVSAESAKVLQGKNFFEISQPVADTGFSWGPQLLVEKVEAVEAIIRLDLGILKPFELVISPLRSQHAAESYLIVARDLTTIRRLEERLKKQAIHDGLTDLFNQAQFHAILEREVARAGRTGRQLGILFFDLDGFKKINDSKGHQAGDDILRRVGRILRSNIRSGLDFAFRYGGDEFAVVFTEAGAELFPKLVSRIKSALDKEFDGEIGISAGMATLAKDETSRELLKRADRASYNSKTSGGNRITRA